MSIREDFEAWAGPKGYPLKTIGTGERISYVYGLTGSAFAGYKEATSLLEAKIKALVEGLELLDTAYCENDMSTREARHRGRVALIKAREAIAAAKE